MQPMVVTAHAYGSPALEGMLKRHPFVEVLSFSAADVNRIEFDSGRKRLISQGDTEVELYGLTELMDNNPLVCADAASVTGAAASLVLVAVGPLAKAELLTEMPAVALNFKDDSQEVDAALATEGWLSGAVVATADHDPEVLTAECICQVRLPGAVDDIRALYDECFGRSFFVRPADDVKENDPYAGYVIDIEPQGDGVGIAKITASAARDGKCGAGGLVHMFNVMCGFEESLGVA
jgi:hypothetical protein